MHQIDGNKLQVIIGEGGIVASQATLSHVEKQTILARQSATDVRGTEEFRAEVRLHSVLKHRVFEEVVKRYKPQIIIDVYGGFVLYVAENSNRKAIPEKSIEVGAMGRVLSLMNPSLQKYVVNDRRYEHPELETPKKFGNTLVYATKQDISLDNIPTHLRLWKTQHIQDNHTQVLILIDPYEPMTQKQLKSVFALRTEMNFAAFLVFSKLTPANASLPRTQLQPKNGETDMPQNCLRQFFLDSQNVYTLFSFGISKTMWKESIESAFGEKGKILSFKDTGLPLFAKRVDELKTQLQNPEYRPVTKAKWELEIKQISENILTPSSLSLSSLHLESVLCACEFHPEVLNLVLPLCLYAVVFEDRHKTFNINSINNFNNGSNNNKNIDVKGQKSSSRKKKKKANKQINSVSVNEGTKKRKSNKMDSCIQPLEKSSVFASSSSSAFASSSLSSPLAPCQKRGSKLFSKKKTKKRRKHLMTA